MTVIYQGPGMTVNCYSLHSHWIKFWCWLLNVSIMKCAVIILLSYCHNMVFMSIIKQNIPRYRYLMAVPSVCWREFSAISWGKGYSLNISMSFSTLWSLETSLIEKCSRQKWISASITLHIMKQMIVHIGWNMLYWHTLKSYVKTALYIDFCT